jgi:hypothetical protein
MEHFVRIAVAVLVVLVVPACGSSGDDPKGPVHFGRVGTMATGESFVAIEQLHQNGPVDNQGLYLKTFYVIVGLEGAQRPADSIPPLLAPDCSDNPPALDPCVAGPLPVGNGQPWRFVLSDGSRIDFKTSGAARTDSNGAISWEVATDALPVDALRANTVLIENASTVEKIDVGNGAIDWAIALPANL